MKTGFVESRHGFQVRRLPGWPWKMTVGALSAVHEECVGRGGGKREHLEGVVKIMRKNLV